MSHIRDFREHFRGVGRGGKRVSHAPVVSPYPSHGPRCWGVELTLLPLQVAANLATISRWALHDVIITPVRGVLAPLAHIRSEEHTSELQSLMRISYAVFCLKK